MNNEFKNGVIRAKLECVAHDIIEGPVRVILSRFTLEELVEALESRIGKPIGYTLILENEYDFYIKG